MKPTEITPINHPREFKIDELFFSITNKKGIITACNDVFVRVSGYEASELIGEPHNCIRHPDMPRCVFKLLWDYLLSGRNIGAYVKNMASTGEFYWVYALVTPVEDGFLSIRIKPSSKYFSVVEALYKNLLEIENSYGKNWREGMEASHRELLVQLNKLGFDNYDLFLNETLREELVSRDRQLKENNIDTRLSKQVKIKNGSQLSLDALFEQIVRLVQSKELLSSKSRFLNSFAHELELIAINSTVQASLLGRDGSPLAVIGEEISRMSKSIKKEVSALTKATQTLVSTVDMASLSVATATLQQEMACIFSRKMNESNQNEAEQIAQLGRKTETLVEVLGDCSMGSVVDATNVIKGLVHNLAGFEGFLEALTKVFQVLQFSYVAGCTEMVRISKEEEFKNLFDGLKDLSLTGSEELKQLSVTIGGLNASIKHALTTH